MFDRIFPIDDITLIEKAKTNQHDFARLYDRFADVVFRFIRRKVNNIQDAEDIVSETFMAVATSLKNYDASKGKFETWLLTIANYKSLSYLRKLYAGTEEELDENREYVYEEDFASIATNKQWHEEILSFIKTLSERQSSIFFLRHVEELSNKEIAEICEVDERTVSSTLSLVY